MRRVLTVFIFITLLWALYRYFFVMPEWADEFLAKPLIDLLPVLIVVIAIERKTVESLGILKYHFIPYVFLGLGIGLLLLLESFLVRFVKYGTMTLPVLTPWNIVLNLFISFATAFTEETVFRGYFFRRLQWIWNNEYSANAVSSLFFMTAHLPLAVFSLHYAGWQLMNYCLLTYLFGVIFAFIFARVKTIVPSTVAHTLWNFANVFIR